MIKCISCLLIILLVFAMAPKSSSAQSVMLVEDLAAVAQLITSGASLLQMVSLAVKDLEPLMTMVNTVTLMQQVSTLITQIDVIAKTIELRANGWRSLMAMKPCRADALSDWNVQASEWNRLAASDALLAMSLISQTVAAMKTLLQIIDSIRILFGTTSGLQTLSNLTSVGVMELQKGNAKMAAHSQAMLGSPIIEAMNVQARRCIRQQRFKNWGTFTRY